MGLPEDPVKAALALVESEARKVDLGYIEVQDLTLLGTAEQGLQTPRIAQRDVISSEPA